MKAEKPGDFPVHEFTTLECVDLCSHDESCSGNQKCVSKVIIIIIFWNKD